MKTAHQKIIDAIAHSDLSFDEQVDFMSAFSNATEDQLEAVSAVMEEYPEHIRVLFENWHAKRAALSLGKQELWNMILDHEAKKLQVA